MRTLIVIAVLILGLTLGKIYWFDAKKESEAGGGRPASASNAGPSRSGGGGFGASAMAVDVYIAKKANTDNIVYASGTISANEQVELRSETSGRLIQLNIKEGAAVQKGQLIAKLNDNDLVAQLKKLEYEEALAAQTEARQKKLIDINAISKEEYESSVNRVKTLSADRELLQVQVEKTKVLAPFSGRIGFKNISEGAYLTPTTIIAQLIQTDPVKIDFAVPEKYSEKIKVGQSVHFHIDGRNEKFTAQVIAIAPQVDESLRTLNIRAKISNPKGIFLPGMFVRVEALLDSEPSIMVPTEAIVPVLKGKKLYVVKNGKAKEAMVNTGLRTEQQIQVLDGIIEGDTIIISALIALKDNLPVSVKKVVD